MAGVKGRSGGKRANAGRKPLTPEQKAARAAARAEKAAEAAAAVSDGMPAGNLEPLPFLEAVMNNPQADIKVRVRAAIAAAQYRHTKLHDGGKKDATAGKAKDAAGGRFSTPGAPPRLAVAGGKRVG